jgi:hypothetical protein
VNADPGLFRAVLLEAPFLDVLSAMLDPSLPLTIVCLGPCTCVGVRLCVCGGGGWGESVLRLMRGRSTSATSGGTPCRIQQPGTHSLASGRTLPSAPAPPTPVCARQCACVYACLCVCLSLCVLTKLGQPCSDAGGGGSARRACPSLARNQVRGPPARRNIASGAWLYPCARVSIFVSCVCECVLPCVLYACACGLVGLGWQGPLVLALSEDDGHRGASTADGSLQRTAVHLAFLLGQLAHTDTRL